MMKRYIRRLVDAPAHALLYLSKLLTAAIALHVLFIVGLVSIVYGIALMSPPWAFILGGFMLAALAFLSYKARRSK